MRRALGILFLTCLMLGAVRSASAQNTSTQESKKAALEREIAQLQKQLQENSKRSASVLGDLTLIRKQLSNRRELLTDSEREIKVISDSISRAKSEAAVLQARLDTMSIYYKRLIKGAYRNRDNRMWFAYILTSSDLTQAARRYSYLRRLSATMNSEAREIQQTRLELEAKLAELDKMKKKAEALKEARRLELEKLSRDEKKSDALIASLNKDKKKYQRELETKRKQVEALNREIERIIAEYVAQETKPASGEKKAGSSKKSIDYKLAADFEKNKGKLPWPADGPVVEKFGRHNHPVYTSMVMPFNNGINLSLSEGEEIRAIFDGEVKNIIVMPGYNKCVLVQHGNYFSFYCKLGQVSVKTGDKIKTGQAIGRVDTIDRQTQLHFQIWKEKTPQNPELWLRPQR